MGRVILALSLVLATFCVLIAAKHPSKCLPPFGKMPFDEVKFSGKWYVVGRLVSEHMPRAPTQCSRVDYAVKESGNITRVTIDYNMKIADKEVSVMTTGQPVNPAVKSVLQSAWMMNTDDEKWKGVITQSVLATDYTSFALSYACKPVYVDAVDMFGKMEVVAIWSREPTMQDTLLEVLKNVLSSYDFAVDDMLMSDNANCV